MSIEKEFHKFLKEIENYFIRFRGTPFIFSPQDVQLLLYWYNKGVSSNTIKDSIKEVFEKLKEKEPEKKVNSLKYCAQVIEKKFKDEKNKASRSWHCEGLELNIKDALDKNIEKISLFFQKRPELKKKEKKISKKMESLKNLEDLDQIEDSLKKIEENLIEFFYKNLEGDKKKLWKKEIEENMPPEAKSLPSFVKNSLIKNSIFEKLKKERDVPNLTLLL